MGSQYLKAIFHGFQNMNLENKSITCATIKSKPNVIHRKTKKKKFNPQVTVRIT